MHRGLDATDTLKDRMSLAELQEGAVSFKPRVGLSPRSRAAKLNEMKAAASQARQDEIARRIAAKSPHRRGDEKFPPNFWPVLEEAVANVAPQDFAIKGQVVATFAGTVPDPKKRRQSLSPVKQSSPVKAKTGTKRQAASTKVSSSMSASRKHTSIDVHDSLYGSGQVHRIPTGVQQRRASKSPAGRNVSFQSHQQRRKSAITTGAGVGSGLNLKASQSKKLNKAWRSSNGALTGPDDLSSIQSHNDRPYENVSEYGDDPVSRYDHRRAEKEARRELRRLRRARDTGGEGTVEEDDPVLHSSDEERLTRDEARARARVEHRHGHGDETGSDVSGPRVPPRTSNRRAELARKLDEMIRDEKKKLPSKSRRLLKTLLKELRASPDQTSSNGHVHSGGDVVQQALNVLLGQAVDGVDANGLVHESDEHAVQQLQDLWHELSGTNGISSKPYVNGEQPTNHSHHHHEEAQHAEQPQASFDKDGNLIEHWVRGELDERNEYERKNRLLSSPSSSAQADSSPTFDVVEAQRQRYQQSYQATLSPRSQRRLMKEQQRANGQSSHTHQPQKQEHTLSDAFQGIRLSNSAAAPEPGWLEPRQRVHPDQATRGNHAHGQRYDDDMNESVIDDIDASDSVSQASYRADRPSSHHNPLPGTGHRSDPSSHLQHPSEFDSHLLSSARDQPDTEASFELGQTPQQRRQAQLHQQAHQQQQQRQNEQVVDWDDSPRFVAKKDTNSKKKKKSKKSLLDSSSSSSSSDSDSDLLSRPRSGPFSLPKSDLSESTAWYARFKAKQAAKHIGAAHQAQAQVDQMRQQTIQQVRERDQPEPHTVAQQASPSPAQRYSGTVLAQSGHQQTHQSRQQLGSSPSPSSSPANAAAVIGQYKGKATAGWCVSPWHFHGTFSYWLYVSFTLVLVLLDSELSHLRAAGSYLSSFRPPVSSIRPQGVGSGSITPLQYPHVAHSHKRVTVKLPAAQNIDAKLARAQESRRHDIRDKY